MARCGNRTACRAGRHRCGCQPYLRRIAATELASSDSRSPVSRMNRAKADRNAAIHATRLGRGLVRVQPRGHFDFSDSVIIPIRISPWSRSGCPPCG
jgi:hypothetical protein